MMKKIISLALTVLVLAALMCPAYADSFSGTGNAVYDGSKINTDFGTTINKIAEGFQPGDDITIEITLKNNCDVSTDWYMSNEVLKPFESGDADNGAYSYSLKYVGTEDKTIFDSSVIGGEQAESIQDATDALNDFFFLGTIGARKTGKVILKMAVDGETQNNDYWNTISQVQMRFAVEKKTDGVTYIVPKTADTFDVAFWGGSTALFVIALIVLLNSDRRKEKAGK